MKLAISSGHGKKVQGAIGILNEHAEAVRVVDAVAENLRAMDVKVATFEDTVSTTQNENLNRIVDWHNSQTRDLDISVHFNAYTETDSPMGTECLYVTQAQLADEMAAAMAAAGGFIDRGPKKRTDLFFLNNTEAPAILLEVCFVDSSADADLYEANFDHICQAIAATASGEALPPAKPEAPAVGSGAALLHVKGKVSYFGGPEDHGVDADEGLAFIYEYDTAPWLFLPQQPPGTTGLARRLNAENIPYVACRWNYDVTPKEMLAKPYPALVRAPSTNKQFLAWPSDWGPHQDTGRVADISPHLMDKLGIKTDDTVEVIYPAPLIRGRGPSPIA